MGLGYNRQRVYDVHDRWAEHRFKGLSQGVNSSLNEPFLSLPVDRTACRLYLK